MLSLSHSVVSNSFGTQRTMARQVPLSMGFSRQEYRSGLPFPSPGIFPTKGLTLSLLHWQEDSLPPSHPGCSKKHLVTQNLKITKQGSVYTEYLSSTSMFLKCASLAGHGRAQILCGYSQSTYMGENKLFLWAKATCSDAVSSLKQKSTQKKERAVECRILGSKWFCGEGSD